jgi:ethanolamine utilization protein EutA
MLVSNSRMQETMSDNQYLSLGLDIGTTTTHLVISRLTIGPGEDPFGRHHLLDKQIVYRSDIHSTPFLDEQTVDAERIHQLVQQEYRRADVSAKDLLTGAVIITGETAARQNAQQVAHRLAGESSSFAAAVAGANQEAILAGRGSGAAEYSRRHRCCTLNVDIGGGTANLAWFDHGRLLDAAAVRIGGRHLMPTDCLAFRVVTETARQFLGTDLAEPAQAEQWIQACRDVCLDAMANRFMRIPSLFVITSPRVTLPEPDTVFFSGGVGDLIYRLQSNQPVNKRFDDNGLQLARALLESAEIEEKPRHMPQDPIRATVIGAGQFAMTLSGETVWMDPSALPLRNLPVIYPFDSIAELNDPHSMAGRLNHHRRMGDLNGQEKIAVRLPSLRNYLYDDVLALGRKLAESCQQAELPDPWIFILPDNLGRLLGQSITQSSNGHSVIVVDELKVTDADYIDIGRPFRKDHPTLPVIAKTLIFQ